MKIILSRRAAALYAAAFVLAFADIAKADLIGAKGTLPVEIDGIPFAGNTYDFKANSDYAFVVDCTGSFHSWIFSSKGTSGDFYPIIIYQPIQGGTVYWTTFSAFYSFSGSGVNPLVWWTDLSGASSYYLVTVGFARKHNQNPPTSELHAVGSTITYNHIKAADNDPAAHTTFYVGTDTSLMDSGVSSSFVEKNNNGAWVSMGYGVDCGQCYSPYVTGFSISGNTVTVTGYFDRGYNANGTEVICGSYIKWINTGSTTGYWSYP